MMLSLYLGSEDFCAGPGEEIEYANAINLVFRAMSYPLPCVKVVAVTDSDGLQVLGMLLLLMLTMIVAVTMTMTMTMMSMLMMRMRMRMRMMMMMMMMMMMTTTRGG